MWVYKLKKVRALLLLGWGIWIKIKIISGSGKSTIVSLIERFFDVNEGEVLIDGLNIKNLNSSFRLGIGYVCMAVYFNISAQDPLLFSGTI
jgi:ABC-type multidrug transport system fused ATPase/permease subunit